MKFMISTTISLNDTKNEFTNHFFILKFNWNCSINSAMCVQAAVIIKMIRNLFPCKQFAFQVLAFITHSLSK